MAASNKISIAQPKAKWPQLWSDRSTPLTFGEKCKKINLHHGIQQLIKT